MNSALLMEMIERMSVAATLAFVLSQTAIFHRLFYRRVVFGDKAVLTIVFGLVGIFWTYAGIPVNDALANSRVIGVMAAGLIGGPRMGMSAGAIAGIHRYFLGGFTAFACAVASICEGLLGGFFHRWYPAKPIPWWIALLAGLIGETMQMSIILLLAPPYDMALSLVQEIAMPMIIVNSMGIAVFMLIIKTAMLAQERAGAEKSQKALDIATETLPYLRRGLNSATAPCTAEIIYQAAGYDAVAITDTNKVLAFTGAEAEHHQLDSTGLTKTTRQVLETGHIQVAQTAKEIGCPCSRCKLASAVVVPLRQADRVIGTLKLYYTRENNIGHGDIVFATGLAHLFSTQLELTEIDRQAKMAARAKLKALNAQINPHFLFNTINTITSLIRTKPDLARELLIKLAAIFRFVLHRTGASITVAEELSQVRAYLAIEQARHGDRLIVREKIAPAVDKYLIPALIIQPLVENAIKHGLQPKENGGTIVICAEEDERDLFIAVRDNGVGMELSSANPLDYPRGESIGLTNVHERLRGQFGAQYGLTLASELGRGTTVTIRLPKRLKEEGEECA